MATVETTPRRTYEDRLAAWQARDDRLARSQDRYRRARTWLFATVVIVAWLGEKERQLKELLVPPVLLLAFVDWRRSRIGRERRALTHRIEYLESRLTVLDGEWAGRGTAGDRFGDDDHPYAADLDLFGRGGVFELLCAARSRPGEETLAAWLRSPAAGPEIRDRHAAIDELRANLDLRERLALLGQTLSAIDLTALQEWLAHPSQPVSAAVRAAGFVVVAVAALMATGGLCLGAGLGFLVASVVLLLGFGWFARNRTPDLFDAVEQRTVDLAALVVAVAPLSREPFAGRPLRDLQTALRPDSPALRRLTWLGGCVRANPPLAILIWATSLGLWIERQRAAASAAAAGLLNAWGAIEALASLAAYAFENPDDVSPEIVDSGPCLEAEALGHPLLPADRCVRNDLHLSGDRSILFVSGSNMSGKSTMLRTAGVNVVLAQAGAPVRAKRLRLSPLAVGGNLRVQDSLRSGRSRFYSEVLRVRQILELAETRPTLALLDELFQGTNSHDRKVGAEAVVRTLLASDAIGLVTTHDLSLTAIADDLAPRSANVHFADQFRDGAMTFDYTMRPGVVRQSNALAVMRSAGIKV